MATDDKKRGIDERLKHDKGLEEEAKRLGAYKVHPLLTKIHSKMGQFNVIRNAANKRQVEIEGIDEE